MQDLRRTLASIILAAPLAGCVQPGTCPPPDRVEDTVSLPAMPDDILAKDLADCRADPMYGCDPLCDELYYRAHAVHREFETCELLSDANGESVHFVAINRCVGGRRPAGYRPRPCNPAVGAYLAEQAALEAASVRAFRDLAADLTAHRAPAAFRRAALHAAHDEIRHARTCDALARRHAARPRYTRIAPAARRTLAELALDNAVEGCVRETFGAVVAGYQARVAADRAIRTAMRGIWRDEAEHAALSWRLHRWLAPRLAPSTRIAIADAMRAARAELADAPATASALCTTAGIPGVAATNALLARLDAHVWSS